MWVMIGWCALICLVALLQTWMRWTGRHLAEPLPRTLLRPHRCADFTTTTEGDGLPRCYPCYRKEWRAKFCGDEWPDAEDAFAGVVMPHVPRGNVLIPMPEQCRAWPEPEGPALEGINTW